MTQRALPLNAIHAFLVTARHLNLTRAAAELCITQGAVSRKISSLEGWLGFALFDRHARGLHLTPQGSSLLPALQSGYQQMLDAALQASRQHATLRLRAPTCAMRWLVPKLVALEKAHPELHVALTTTVNHRPQLENFDAAVLYGHEPAGRVLFEEALIPVMAPGLLSQPPEDAAALAPLTFLHPTADRRDWQLWLAAQGQQLEMRRSQHFATMDLAIAAAVQGFGVTVADRTLVADDLAAQRLIAPLAAQVKTGAVYSLLRRSAASPWLDRLEAWLSD